jgi:nucleoside-diphosphate-sugar epimerase
MTESFHILVTGARGFIGQPLCRALVENGYQVTGTIRRLNSEDNPLPGLQFRETGDLEAFEDWAYLLQGVAVVVHLAARVHVMGESGAAASEKYRNANVAVTEKSLRAAASAGVRRFVFLSSVKAIGEGGTDVYTETTLAEPTDPYGISKLEAEKMVQTIGNEIGIETVILRLPLVYGPEVRANFLRLMKLVERGIPLPIASIRKRRSMIYIGNVVLGLLLGLQH